MTRSGIIAIAIISIALIGFAVAELRDRIGKQ